jgi:acyl-CoA dehydrogenase
VDWALEQGVIKEEESEPLLEALTALYDVLRVDAFDDEGLKALARCAKGKRKVVERPPRDEQPDDQK